MATKTQKVQECPYKNFVEKAKHSKTCVACGLDKITLKDLKTLSVVQLSEKYGIAIQKITYLARLTDTPLLLTSNNSITNLKIKPKARTGKLMQAGRRARLAKNAMREKIKFKKK